MKKLMLAVFLLFPVLASATITGTSNSVTYTCTGSTGPFTFSFPAYDAGSIEVIETTSGGVSTLIPSSGYTLTPVNNSYMNGGSVLLSTACASGSLLTIQRATEETQLSAFTNNMPALYKTFESSLDKLTMEIQDAPYPKISGLPGAGNCVEWISNTTLGDAGVPCTGFTPIPSSYPVINVATQVAACSTSSSFDTCVNGAFTQFSSATAFDLRGLAGAQLTWTAATNITSPANVNIIWPDANVTRGSGSQWLYDRYTWIRGSNQLVSKVTGNDSTATFVPRYRNGSPHVVEWVHFSDLGCWNTNFPSGIMNPCFDLGGVHQSNIERSTGSSSPGVILGEYDGSYWNSFYEDSFPQAFVLHLANHNTFKSAKNPSSGKVGGVVVVGGANKFEDIDFEDAGFGVLFRGTSNKVLDAYFESNGGYHGGLTPVWQANHDYGYGQTVVDSATTHVFMCYNDNTLTGSTFNYSTPSCGTSGSSEPSWNTTRGQTTDDGVSAMWLCISVTDVIFDSTSLANAVVGLGNVASLYITSDNITNTVDVQGGIGSAFYQTFSPQYYFPVQGICFGGDKECGYGATGSLETINNGAGNQGLAAFKYGSFIGGAASQNFGFQGIFHAMEWGMGTDYQYGYFYLKSLSQPTAPTCTVVGTPGAVAYDYWVVAHIGNTTAGAIATGTIASVPSATCTVYPPTSMNSSNYVAIVPPVKTGTGASDSYWSASYDVLKETSGTTPPAHSILTNVQLTKNTSGVIPFKDIGQSSTAYTALTTASQPGILMDCKPVGNLPAAASGNKGMQACVSDSTTVSAEGQTCTGGSNVTALAFSNGSAWKCF